MELDDLINGALKSYVAQQPRDGLENRILQRVRAEGQLRPRIHHWLAWSGAAMACAVFFIVGVGYRSEKVRVEVPPRVRVELPKASLSASTLVRRARHVADQRRPPVFPSPTPLTDQERALVAFVATAPTVAVIAFIDQQQDIVPIKIESLEITPLQSIGEQ